MLQVEQVVGIEIKIPGGEFRFLMHHGKEPVHLDPGSQFFIEMIKSAQVEPVYLMKSLADHGQVKTHLLLGRNSDRC